MSDTLFNPPPLAVSQLNALARQLLEQNLANLWVSGEISNLTRASSGHYYFSLKDNKAQVRCALFKSHADRLTTPLREGDQVELTGKITLYEARGEFQISVNQLRLAGMGSLFEAYERLKAQLASEGVFDAERKQALPPHPQTIGIVTSTATAALRDIVSTLKRRMSSLKVIVYPTAVQGKGSEFQITKAIHTASERNEVDVLLVCRGSTLGREQSLPDPRLRHRPGQSGAACRDRPLPDPAPRRDRKPAPPAPARRGCRVARPGRSATCPCRRADRPG